MDNIYNDIESLINKVNEAENECFKNPADLTNDSLYLYSARKFLISAYNEIEKVSPDFGEAE